MYKRSILVLRVLQNMLLTIAVLGVVIPLLTADANAFLPSFVILIPLTVIWVLTPRCTRYYQYVFLHALLWVFIFFLARRRPIVMMTGTVYTVIRLLAVILTQRDREDEGITAFDTAALILPGFLFLPAVFAAERYQEFLFPWVRTFYILLFSGWLILFFCRYYLLRHAEFADQHRHTSQMPLGQITHVNHRILMVFLAIAAVLFFFLPFTHLDALLLWIPQLLLFILRWLLSLLPTAQDVGEDQPVDPVLPGFNPESTGEQNPVLALIGEILAAAVLIAVAAVTLLALYRLLSARITHIEAPDVDVKEYIGADERRSGIRRDRDMIVPWYDLSPSGRARRAYIHRIQATKKSGVFHRSFTPSQIEHAAGLPEDQAFHDLYEKARYSENGITREEWENRSPQA